MPDGSDCWREPEPDGYAGICTEHMHAVAKAWVGDPVLQRVRCQKCRTLSLVRDRLTRILMCAECVNVTMLEGSPDWQPTDIDERHLGTRAPNPAYPVDLARPRTDVVYYIRFGNRIKIGTTTNLPKRMEVLPHDEILAIEPGDTTREHGRHAEFRRHLTPGQREWFEVAPAILGHASALRAKYGPPMAAWRNWSRRDA
jgi:hypothetical protein